ncbi:MAG: MFS transporter [Nanoarchaeota archaeon]|nr:MFS transporter [Nanoarchaeota archaeon]MBU0962841.1 MFS transporter [Nanoarchaeota archaeon]
MNKTLKLLIISDVFLWSGLGLISPILAIFIKDNLIGGTIAAAGIASAIYLITHATLQIIFAKVFNPKDRLWMLLLGTFLIILVPIGYLFSTNVWHLFLTQLMYGVGAGFAFPSWSSLFTSNLEKGKRGFQWAIYSSSVSFGMAITAYIGAQMVNIFNFKIVFIFSGIISLIGLLILFLLEKKELMKKI